MALGRWRGTGQLESVAIGGPSALIASHVMSFLSTVDKHLGRFQLLASILRIRL